MTFVNALVKSFPALQKNKLVRAYITEKEVEKKEKEKRLSYALTRQRRYAFQAGMDDWRMAIVAAENPEMPDRSLLLTLYKQAMYDAHLVSAVENRLAKTIGSPFIVRNRKTETEDKEATKLINKPWFAEYARFFLESKFYGHSLIEFQEMQPGKDLPFEFKKVLCFPREHVRPETGEILMIPGAGSGIPFREPPFNRWLMEAGGTHFLGFLQVAAREAIWKSYSRSDWSRHSEKYGLPALSIKTTTKDSQELDKIEEMAANFGSNLYMITDDADTVDILESMKNNPHLMYHVLCQYTDEQLSKLIVGQTSISDEKSYVGSAEVAERQFNEIIEMDKRDFQNHVNYELIDFLIGHGYKPLEGKEMVFKSFLEAPEQQVEGENGDQDPGPGGNPKPKPKPKTGNFNRPTRNVAAGVGQVRQQIKALYPEAYQAEPGAVYIPVISDLSKIVTKLIKAIYEKKVVAGDLDAGLMLATAGELWKGVKEGYGSRIDSPKLSDIEKELVSQLRTNINVFAAFKNHANILDMVEALIDENGVLRSFSDFREIAQSISDDYNINWLRTEYDTAKGSARMAQKWQRIKRRTNIANLKYTTMRDGRVRPDHRTLEGIILPVTHTFWLNYYPPNGWKCRCDALQTNKTETDAPEELPEVIDMFRNNVGISGKIFTDAHPYFTTRPADRSKITEILKKFK